MHLSWQKRWNWLASAVLALALGVFLGARVEVQASHPGQPYPTEGFQNIAQGGAASYYIPSSSFNGTLLRDGHTRWNNLRNGGYTAYATESGTYSNWQQVQWRRSSVGSGYGTFIYRGTASNCQLGTVGHWCKSEVVVDYNEPESSPSASHELGHAMFALADHGTYDCSTIMSSCLYDMSGPTAQDAHGAALVYGIPTDIAFYPNYNGTTTDWVCWTDNSNYKTGHILGLWKWVNGWQWQHDHSFPAQSGTGWRCFSEEIFSELGSGEYLYGVYANNQYPNAVSGSQFAGFTNSGFQ